MKTALVVGAAVAAAALAVGATDAEVRDWVVGMGGQQAAAPGLALRSYVGPAVVGVSAADGLTLVHGPVPRLAGGISGVEETDRTPPAAARLHQNAPNPFNPRTTIRYDLPVDAGRVRLRLYDAAGRLVRTLVDGPQGAGAQSVVWNGRDDGGRPVATGVYFCELVTPDRRFTRKMTLLR